MYGGGSTLSGALPRGLLLFGFMGLLLFGFMGGFTGGLSGPLSPSL